MRNKVREGIFETNSSSVHSLVFLNQKLSKPNFRELKIDKDGIIKIPLGYFGREKEIYSTQKEKLSYIATIFWCLFGENTKPFKTDDDSYYYFKWNQIKEEIIKYINSFNPKINCTDILPYMPRPRISDYYIKGFDHQTYPHNLEDCIIDLYEPEEVVNFIFNENMALQTNSD